MKTASTEEALTLSKQLDKTKREVAYALTSKKRREEKQQQQQNSSNADSPFDNHNSSNNASNISRHQDSTPLVVVPANSIILQPGTALAVSPSPMLGAKTTTKNFF